MGSEDEPKSNHNQFEISQAPKSEQFQPIILSSREQQDAIFSALYYRLLDETNLEVDGGLKKYRLERNKILRDTLKELAINLEKTDELKPLDWLMVGIPEFVPEDLLHQWANPAKTVYWTDETLRDKARYFEQKKQEKKEDNY